MNVRCSQINILQGVHTIYDLNGDWHRSNGPAYVWASGFGEWMLFDKEHRYYGPQRKDGDWYIHGNRIKQCQIK